MAGNTPVQKETEQAILNKATDATYGTLANQAYVEQVSDASSRRQSGAVVGSQVAAFVQILDAAGAAITSFGGGTQYADGALRGTATGTLAMGDDGTNIQSIHVDASGDLQVDVLTMPTVAVTGTFWQATQPVSIAASVAVTYAALLTELQLKADLTETQPVSLASVPSHAVTNAGTFVVQENGAALTALQLIDNIVSGTGVNVSQINGVAPLMGVGATGTGSPRVTIANDNGKTIVSTGGSAASAGNNTLVAAGTNKLKVKAFSLSTISTTAMICIFQSGASGTELWRVILQAPSGANAGANLSVPAPDYLFATASATLLNLNLSSANAVHWSVSYYDES